MVGGARRRMDQQVAKISHAPHCARPRLTPEAQRHLSSRTAATKPQVAARAAPNSNAEAGNPPALGRRSVLFVRVAGETEPEVATPEVDLDALHAHLFAWNEAGPVQTGPLAPARAAPAPASAPVAPPLPRPAPPPPPPAPSSARAKAVVRTPPVRAPKVKRPRLVWPYHHPPKPPRPWRGRARPAGTRHRRAPRPPPLSPYYPQFRNHSHATNVHVARFLGAAIGGLIVVAIILGSQSRSASSSLAVPASAPFQPSAPDPVPTPQPLGTSQTGDGFVITIVRVADPVGAGPSVGGERVVGVVLHICATQVGEVDPAEFLLETGNVLAPSASVGLSQPLTARRLDAGQCEDGEIAYTVSSGLTPSVLDYQSPTAQLRWQLTG